MGPVERLAKVVINSAVLGNACCLSAALWQEKEKEKEEEKMDWTANCAAIWE